MASTAGTLARDPPSTLVPTKSCSYNAARTLARPDSCPVCGLHEACARMRVHRDIALLNSFGVKLGSVGLGFCLIAG
jgi:hypothetical protein